jgi:murein DD-endopeptidase MepM/ murein hydrolase activator NlpD
MRRNRRDNGKRERIIMLASSAFVLAALTMTGVYIQSKNTKQQDDGYVIDFTALENSVDEKAQEIAQNQQSRENASEDAQEEQEAENKQAKAHIEFEEEPAGADDDLDYMPIAANSDLVEIPGLTDQADKEEAATEQAAVRTSAPVNLHFAETDGLLRPVEGEVLLPFSMDSSIYFSTLDQYKYIPALMLVAVEGEEVTACAAGKVTDIFEDAQIGQAVTMDLGGGYEITYGQLKEISVKQDSYVKAGEVIGEVWAPTKYFSLEGANLYLKLTAEGVPVNPEPLFQ